MKIKILFLYFVLTIASTSIYSQYVFKDEIRIPCTEIKNQQLTGTCWSFGTTSFLESEIMRIKKVRVDLSEMYNVKMAYQVKAQNYVLRQGKARFSEGGLPHDVLNIAGVYGIVPQEAYSGLVNGDTILDHTELQEVLTSFLDAVIKTNKPSKHWKDGFNGIVEAYLGKSPEQFTFMGKVYNPVSFRDAMGIKTDDYISITSFNHHPFYSSFILEIPDNYMNGSYYNVPLDEMMRIIDFALEKGYSLAWDGDVSEKGLSGKNGLAILPVDTKSDDIFSSPVKEILVNENNRQENFMNYRTQDDHIMHVIGKAKDQNENVYYIIKNSWGSGGTNKGYMYMSKAFMRMKTLSVTVHKEALEN